MKLGVALDIQNDNTVFFLCWVKSVVNYNIMYLFIYLFYEFILFFLLSEVAN